MSSELLPWAPGPGIVELPDGRMVRGRGLRHGPPSGPPPEVGFYLLGRPPGPLPWPAVWIRWPDFRLPADQRQAVRTLVDAFDRCGQERVEIACGGGRGRTGCALAVLGVLGGIAPDHAVAWVRAVYDHRAVETPWQRRWVRRLDAARLRA